MDLPIKFSIVIPFFNREKYLGKAIKSVLDQTNSNWELILVDDDSTDNSLKIAESFTDPRIRVLSHSPNRGNAFTRNEGWKSSNYTWVAYLDSDDWYEPDYLDRMSKSIMNNPEVGFFWTGVRFVNEQSQSMKEEFWKPREVLPSTTFFDELRIGTNCGVAFRKELLERYHGFDESFRASVDREFFLRISRSEIGLGIPNILVNCLLGEHESVRKNYSSQATAYRNLIDKYSKEIKESLSRRRWWYHKAMWLSLYAGDNLIAIEFLKKLNYTPRSLVLFVAFQLLPLNLAKKLHKKLA